MKETKLSPTKELASRVIFEAMKILSENGGEMRMSEILKRVESRIELNEWARTTYEKTGYVRWQSIAHFYSIDCVKAGFLVKRKGVWFITPEGEQALSEGPVAFLEEATRKYREWSKEQGPKKPQETVEGEADQPESRELQISFEQIQTQALESITNAINAKSAYEFQDLAAALLRGMGYYTPFVAPLGKDGGIDIIGYRDPLGTESPRIKVQVKHQGASTAVKDIRQLMGLLQKDGDVGIFFSTGGFTPDAKSTARSSHVHVELIDLERFIDLWRQFYEKLTDEDKSLLPLTPVYFHPPQS